MKKTFFKENEIGMMIKYTVLAITMCEGKEYVVYTNYLPSDNELGVRLFAGEIADRENFTVVDAPKAQEKKIIDAFKAEIISSGQKIRRVKSK